MRGSLVNVAVWCLPLCPPVPLPLWPPTLCPPASAVPLAPAPAPVTEVPPAPHDEDELVLIVPGFAVARLQQQDESGRGKPWLASVCEQCAPAEVTMLPSEDAAFAIFIRGPKQTVLLAQVRPSAGVGLCLRVWACWWEWVWTWAHMLVHVSACVCPCVCVRVCMWECVHVSVCSGA